MKSAPWSKVREVLERVLDSPPDMRDLVLDSVDLSVRNEVKALLEFDPSSPSARAGLQTGLGVAENHAQWPTAQSAAGMVVGQYRLESLIAEGGMGAVYLGHRCEGDFDQLVAVKLLKPGLIGSTMMRNFHAERQTLARLEHPFITRLFDGGTSPEGIPYLVMEYVRGEPIDAYCRRCELTTAERLRIFVNVCDAVDHAHRALIIHRDLKPDNILVTSDGVPKLIDFGIAKLLDLAGDGCEAQTQTVHRPMTPRYASPEQQSGEGVTTASDVYSLGVILDELLDDPTEPKTKTGAANRARTRNDELATIIAKATHVEPDRRYGGVREFAADIERYLTGHPILARKDTVWYRTRKFAQRNRFACAAGVLALFAVVAGGVGVALSLRQARHDRSIAVAAQEDAEQISAFMQQIYSAANPYRNARDVTIVELLNDATARVEAELTDKPRVEAGVRLAIGQTYAGLWQWDRATPHLERSLQLYREHSPQSRDKIAECLSWLGRARTFAANEESVTMQLEAMRIRSDLYGENDLLVAESKCCLAYAYWHGTENPAHRNWKKADRLYAEAIAAYQAAEPNLTLDQRRDLARFTFSYAVMKNNLDKPQEALALFEDAIQLYHDIGGSADRYMVACVERYAWTLQAQGQYAKAEALLRESIALTPADLQTPITMTNQWRLVELRSKQDDPKGAATQCRSALETYAATIANDYPEQAATADRIVNEFNESEVTRKSTFHALTQLSQLHAKDQYPVGTWKKIVLNSIAVSTSNSG